MLIPFGGISSFRCSTHLINNVYKLKCFWIGTMLYFAYMYGMTCRHSWGEGRATETSYEIGAFQGSNHNLEIWKRCIWSIKIRLEDLSSLFLDRPSPCFASDEDMSVAQLGGWEGGGHGNYPIVIIIIITHPQHNHHDDQHDHHNHDNHNDHYYDVINKCANISWWQKISSKSRLIHRNKFWPRLSLKPYQKFLITSLRGDSILKDIPPDPVHTVVAILLVMSLCICCCGL